MLSSCFEQHRSCTRANAGVRPLAKKSAALLQRENIDRAALRHLGVFARKQQVHARLHLGWIDAPPGLHRDILLVVDLERHRHPRYTRDGRELPQDLPGLGVESAEQAVVCAAGEQDVAAGRQHWPPIERRQIGGPYLLAAVDVPSLQLADMIGAIDHHHDILGHAHVALADDVFRRLARELVAQVIVGWDIYQPRVRTERDRRPILAAPKAWTELRRLAGAGLAFLVDVRPTSLGVEALEYILAHIGSTGHEVDLVRGALEVPDVATARDIDQALHGSAVALIVENDRWRDLVPVPRIVGMILEMPLDCAGIDVERND